MIQRPLIVDIKRYSLEDGPGIRSVVFFKGCPLRCTFCHNPETRRPWMEIVFSAGDCIRCGACAHVCPAGAIDLESSDRILRDRCNRCGRCADVCPGRGLRRVGEYFTVERLTKILLQDRAYYQSSGGGVTLSGGECTQFPHYLELLLTNVKAAGINVLLETCGYFNYATFEAQVLPFMDGIYFDLKFADPVIHAKFTGRPNHRIRANFERLLRERTVDVLPRIPLVPGLTATEENLSAMADYLRGLEADRVMLLPYNPMGLDKYACLGLPRPDLPDEFMKPDEEGRIREIMSKCAAKTGHPGVPIEKPAASLE
ncbi:MAG: glycyl-radical enzyme activating protein [Pseudomonadota bacterium]